MAGNTAIPMIKDLLNRQPSRRGTAAKLKNHDWFKNMNWEDLYYRAIQPPYTPVVEEINVDNPMHGDVQDILLKDEQLENVRGRVTSKTGWDEHF